MAGSVAGLVDLGRKEPAPPAVYTSVRPPSAAAPAGCAGRAGPQGALPGPPDFASWYQEEHGGAVRLAYLLVGDREAARDIAQDCFARVLPRWSRIDAPSAYLRRAVLNACRSHHRRRFLAARHRPGLSAVAVPGADEQSDELGDALGRLPHKQRAALVLRYYADMPEADIARVLGCAEGTVASLVHRGIKELAKVIER